MLLWPCVARKSYLNVRRTTCRVGSTFVFLRFGIMIKVVKVGEEAEMQFEKTVKIAAGLAVTLVALGIIANLKDIKRYWRISTM